MIVYWNTIENDSTIEVDDDAMKDAIIFMMLVRDYLRVEITLHMIIKFNHS